MMQIYRSHSDNKSEQILGSALAFRDFSEGKPLAIGSILCANCFLTVGHSYLIDTKKHAQCVFSVNCNPKK
jgi:hypothetical protein